MTVSPFTDELTLYWENYADYLQRRRGVWPLLKKINVGTKGETIVTKECHTKNINMLQGQMYAKEA
jgi:hypothetical protein